MNFFIILLLALDLRVFCLNYPVLAGQNSKDVEVVIYSGVETCPKIIQPVCATNGKDFMSFKNKCYLEVKNYELLIQGMMEYFECPLTFCKSYCPTCDLNNEPVCAVEMSTGVKKIFSNPCEVERRICTTKKEWRIINLIDCNSIQSNRILSSPQTFSHNAECPQYCTLEYQPICARFMSLVKEFSNDCELKTTICQTKQHWNIIRRGPCQASHSNVAEFFTIEDDCPLEYKALCAKLYNNLKKFNKNFELENIIPRVGQEKAAYLESRKEPQYAKCPKFCDKKYEPVCAEYKGKQREFLNSCELLKAKCETNVKWEIINWAPCSTNTKLNCPQFCTTEYRPICAIFKSRLKEFENKCVFQKTICETNTNWKYLKKGRCPLVPPESNVSCPKLCATDFNPVCAKFNGELREFFNNCELQKIACETNTAWKLIKRGSCFERIAESACDNYTLDPICATYDHKNKTFNNICLLAKEIELTGNNWSILYKGICPVTNTSVDGGSSSPITEETRIVPTTNKPYSSEAAPLTITTEKNYTITTVEGNCNTTLKYTEHKATKEVALAYNTTNHTTPATTYWPKNDTTENIKYSSIKLLPICKNISANSDESSNNPEQYNGEDVVDIDTNSYEDSNSSLNYNFSREEEHFSTTSSYETPSSENHDKSNSNSDINYSSFKVNNSSNNYENLSRNNDGRGENYEHNYSSRKDKSVAKILTTETYEDYTKENNDGKRTTEEYIGEELSGLTDSYETKEDHKNETVLWKVNNLKEIKTQKIKGGEKFDKIDMKEQMAASYTQNSKEVNKILTENKTEVQFSHSINKKSSQEAFNINRSLNLEKLDKKDKEDVGLKKYFKPSLTKAIEKQIQAKLSQLKNYQQYDESVSVENGSQNPKKLSKKLKFYSDESQEDYSSSEEYEMHINDSHAVDANINPTNTNEIKAQLVVSSKEYSGDLNQSANNNEAYKYSYKPSRVDKTLHHEVNALAYSNQNVINLKNNRKNVSIYRNFLNRNTKNRYKILRKENQRYEQTTPNSRKDEVYTGVVYKAPFYDAPTYNFIYTAPFNFHGFDVKYPNQSSSKEVSNAPLHPFHILPFSADKGERFIKSNFIQKHNIMANNAAAFGEHSNADNYKAKWNSLSRVNSEFLSQKEQITRINPNNLKRQFISSLPTLDSNFTAESTDVSLLKQKQENIYPSQQHHAVPGTYKTTIHVPPSLLSKPYIESTSAPSQTSTHSPTKLQYHSIPQQFSTNSVPVSVANAHQFSLDSTLLNRILEELKTIINR